MIIGFTRNIFNGTASSEELHNYYVRTIEPILTRIQEEFQRKFLTKTAQLFIQIRAVKEISETFN